LLCRCWVRRSSLFDSDGQGRVRGGLMALGEAEKAEPHEGVSRRRMLKRLGAGAAVAWTVPVVTSLHTRAFAALSGGCPAPRCSTCIEMGCPGFNPCQSGSCYGGLGCSRGISTEGECLCFQTAFCSCLTPCSSSSDCPPGQHCLCPANGCGMSVCL